MGNKTTAKQQVLISETRNKLPDADEKLLIEMKFLSGVTATANTYYAALAHIRASTGNLFVPSGWDTLDFKMLFASLMINKSFAKVVSITVYSTVLSNNSKIKH